MRLLQEVGDNAVKLKVTAADGVVSIRGTVTSDAVKDRAEECVKDIKGVKRVENMIATK